MSWLDNQHLALSEVIGYTGDEGIIILIYMLSQGFAVMTRWFVSRHPGAIEWAARQKLSVDRFVPHLNVSDVQSGDCVYGTLPMELAAEVCRRGARFFSLCMNVTKEQRGCDLTAEALFQMNARLREYHIIELEHDNDI